MTNEELLAKIKAEIERRIDIIKPKPGQGFILCEQITKQLKELLSFLSTLDSENPVEGLEEEIDLYLEKNYDYNSEYDTLTPNDGFFFSPRHFRNLARHFYELGLNARKED